jgi:hypothetical protein
MSILKILPNAIDSTANYVFGGIISNGVDLDAAVAAAYSQANTSAGGDSFARQTANAAFEAANTKLSTSGGTITGNLIVNAFTANTITANGVNLGTAVAEAFVLANNANKTTTSDTAPADPKVGDSWFDTVTNVLLRYTNDGVSNNWIDITGPQNAGFIYQSYSITPNTSTINETTGNTVIYTVATTNTADNTVLYWTNSGTTVAADFSDSVSNGSVTITNNSGTITRSLVGDLTTEGSETIILNLRTGSNTGTVVAVSPTVTIGDTSQTPFTINYLLIAGGGGGSFNRGGGGGGGGYINGNTTSLLTGVEYTITVGTGGAKGVGYATASDGGNTSTSFAITPVGGYNFAVGGGGAGGFETVPNRQGSPGGSGGGGNGAPGSPGGSGIPGQGNDGGSTGPSNAGAGGGGAGSAGTGGVGADANPAGGSGATWFNGVTYSAGGTGGNNGEYPSTEPNAGDNTGNGGNGGKGFNGIGGNGGSGIAILRYLGTPVATGGTITQSGGYTYHTFTSSNTFTLS